MEGLLCYHLLNYYSRNGHSQEYIHKHITNFERQVHVPLNLQKKYFVFEDALLSLFEKCQNCSSTTTNIIKTTIGPFLHVKQSVWAHLSLGKSTIREKYTCWEHHSLCIYFVCWCFTIQDTTSIVIFLAVHPFLLKLFSPPVCISAATVWSVWEHHQSSLLAELKREHKTYPWW